MAKINLLYVITKLELGGAQSQLLSLVRHIDKERFNILLFTANSGLLMPEALSISDIVIQKSRFLERPINPFKDALALIEIYHFIKKNAVKIVHTHSSKAGILARIAARLAKVKVVVHTVHGWSFNDFQHPLVRRLFIWLEKIAALCSHKLIVVCEHDRQRGLVCKIAPPDKYAFIYYGINYEEFIQNGLTIREEFGIENGDLVVGMVACFKPQKAPLDFIKLAFKINQAALSRVKFILVGDGLLRRHITRLINKLNLQKKVILTGWRRDIPKILSSIDIFALTSLWEGLPISVLEAMASSKPVVATDTGGIREAVIEGKTGFLVKPGDVEGMFERLTFLLNDENQRRIIGEKAREGLGSHFCVENTLKKTYDLYYSLMDK